MLVALNELGEDALDVLVLKVLLELRLKSAVDELLGLLALLLEDDDELTDAEEDVETDEKLCPPVADLLLELETDRLLELDGEV